MATEKVIIFKIVLSLIAVLLLWASLCLSCCCTCNTSWQSGRGNAGVRLRSRWAQQGTNSARRTRRDGARREPYSYVVCVMCSCFRLYIRASWCPSILQSGRELANESHCCQERSQPKTFHRHTDWIHFIDRIFKEFKFSKNLPSVHPVGTWRPGLQDGVPCPSPSVCLGTGTAGQLDSLAMELPWDQEFQDLQSLTLCQKSRNPGLLVSTALGSLKCLDYAHIQHF